LHKLLVISIGLLIVAVGSSALFSSAHVQRTAPQNVEIQNAGISGRVLDAEGHPIAGLTVLAERTDIVIQPMPRAWTDKNGDFIIQGLEPGPYTLYTRKDEDGYPHTGSSFYDEGPSVELRVQVSTHQITSNVIIQRGSKAAVLQGVIVDATTNRPVQKAQITARQVHLSERFLSTGLFWHEGSDPLKFVPGGFKFPVPSSIAFTLKISAPGYEDWYYKIPGSPELASSLLLASNTTKQLAVRLQPQTKARRKATR
jgi:hypothetical protein